jgi:type VI secretion system protein ImpJ
MRDRRTAARSAALENTAHTVPEAIQWHEGMLLAPQHFQQMEQRNEALLHYHVAMMSPFHWGVRHLRIDPVLLAQGVLRVLELEAILPDGLVLSAMRDSTTELAIELTEHADQMRRETLFAFVAVAVRRRGRPVVGGDLARYESLEGEAVADDNASERELPIPRLVPRAHLIVGNELPARYVGIPIALIRCRNQSYELTPYVPPMLRVPAQSPLGELCRRVIEGLRSRASDLVDRAQAATVSGRGGRSRVVSDLAALTAGLPVLEALVATGVSHPYPMYLALCSIAGHVAPLAEASVPPVFPPYNHDDLHDSFSRVCNFILEAISGRDESAHFGVPFDFDGEGFTVFFDPAWVGASLVLAVRARNGANMADLQRWVEGSIIGSRSRLPELNMRRTLGAPRWPIASDGDLVSSQSVCLYAIEYDGHTVVAGDALEVRNFEDPDERNVPVEITLHVRAGA